LSWSQRFTHRIIHTVSDWLTEEQASSGTPMCDFERLRYEIRPCDVLLVEGRSRVSEVIKFITQSPWSHSALYLGRLHDISDPEVREWVSEFGHYEPDTQLIIESLLGNGTVISPLSNYKEDHIRICRPKGITHQDAQSVSGHAIRQLGMAYDIRQLLDLARFLYPYHIFPKRWRSSLFEYNIGKHTRIICSTLIAQAFMSVHFPILPVVKRHMDQIALYEGNPRLFTPKDFDYSPYFEIVKYPLIEIGRESVYRQLPWGDSHHNREKNLPNDQAEWDNSQIKTKLKMTKKKSVS